VKILAKLADLENLHLEISVINPNQYKAMNAQDLKSREVTLTAHLSEIGSGIQQINTQV
jgi:hypothetical protein